MKTLSRTVLTILSVVIVASAATAGIRTPVVNRREHRQMNRIQRGVRSGELTKPEAGHLLKQQQEIRQDEREAKQDGVVTPQERLKLNREMNRSSRQIFRRKHNNRVR